MKKHYQLLALCRKVFHSCGGVHLQASVRLGFSAAQSVHNLESHEAAIGVFNLLGLSSPLPYYLSVESAHNLTAWFDLLDIFHRALWRLRWRLYQKYRPLLRQGEAKFPKVSIRVGMPHFIGAIKQFVQVKQLCIEPFQMSRASVRIPARSRACAGSFFLNQTCIRANDLRIHLYCWAHDYQDFLSKGGVYALSTHLKSLGSMLAQGSQLTIKLYVALESANNQRLPCYQPMIGLGGLSGGYQAIGLYRFDQYH